MAVNFTAVKFRIAIIAISQSIIFIMLSYFTHCRSLEAILLLPAFYLAVVLFGVLVVVDAH